MSYDPLRLSKLPDGKTIYFTMDVQDLIDALLWEDEDHEPWAESNLEIRYVADNAQDGVPPTVRGWELILESAQSDYENTKRQEHGELCREIIATLSGDDPGEWKEKKNRGVLFHEMAEREAGFQPRFRRGGNRVDPLIWDEELAPDEQLVKSLQDHMKEMMKDLRRRGW